MRAKAGAVIPAMTVRVARASNPKGTVAMWVRDRLDGLWSDADFAAWYPRDGRPGISPAQLATVSVLQYLLRLSDRATAEAIRCRIDFKYGLALDLDDPGFDHSVLGDFRDRLAEDDRADGLFDLALTRLREAGLVKERGRQRTDSTHVLAAVRDMNRLELVAESVRDALEDLARYDPAWLAPLIEQEWGKRYGRPPRPGRLPHTPQARLRHAEQAGADGQKILRAVWAADAPAVLRTLPQVEVLRRVWVEQYFFDADAGRLRWRSSGKGGQGLPPPLTGLVSPYDTEVRYARRGGTIGRGYMAHVTETCDDGDEPRVITDVLTTHAPIHDSQVLPVIRQRLGARGLLPREHLVDGGYISIALMDRTTREHGITLTGPVRKNYSRQNLKNEGFGKDAFHIDFDRRQAVCPRGKTSSSWKDPAQVIEGVPYILVKFRKADCTPCPVRIRCAGSATAPRALSLLPENLHHLLGRLRIEQQSP